VQQKRATSDQGAAAQTPMQPEERAMKAKAIEAAQAVSEFTQEARTEAGVLAAKTYDQTVSNMKAGVVAMTSGIKEAQERMKQQMETAIRTAEELVSFGQGNLEAVMKSGQIWFAGVQDISKQVTSTAQEQVDASVSALRALSTVRSPKEAFAWQTNVARSSFERTMAETRRLTDSSYKLVEQTVAPLAARVSVAFERFGRVPV
jgi:phasin family protein